MKTTMNVQPFELTSPNPIDRIASHCDPKSPVGRPTTSCHRCKLRHLKCVIRRNVEGEIVGCTHCLTSNDFSVVCTLANPTTFHSYRPLFHHRLLTTEDFDARKLCVRHEDATTNNAFHPPALQASDSHLHPLSGRESNHVAVDARLPNGSPGPGFADSNMNAVRVSVDARLPNGSPGPGFTDCNIDADQQCISCVHEHLPMFVSPLKFQYQMKNKQTNGHIRGVRRMFYIPDHEVNTFHAHEIRQKRVKYIPKCAKQIFIECNSFPFRSLSHGARGCLVMFRSHGMDGYKLGVISGIMYHVEQINGPKLNGVVRLYEWVGKQMPNEIFGDILDMYHCYESFDELTTGRLDGHQFKIRLTEREFHLGKDDDHFHMVFVNRCMGNDYESRYDDVVNPIDGCVQHSSNGKSTPQSHAVT